MRHCALVFLSLVTTAGFARGETAASIVERIQKSYERIGAIEARFHQTYRSRRFEEKKVSGKVAIAKPGKMRWDYDEPKGKVLVSDGTTITLYDPEDRQAMVSPQPKGKELPVALLFLGGGGKLSDEFDCKKVEGLSKADLAVLSCAPKKPVPNVSDLVLTVSLKEPVVVTATRIVDEMGGESEIRFSDIRRDPKINDARFKFSPPKGAAVVSLAPGGIKME